MSGPGPDAAVKDTGTSTAARGVATAGRATSSRGLPTDMAEQGPEDTLPARVRARGATTKRPIFSPNIRNLPPGSSHEFIVRSPSAPTYEAEEPPKVERIVTRVFYRITTWEEREERLEKFGEYLGPPPEYGAGWELAIVYKGMVEPYVGTSTSATVIYVPPEKKSRLERRRQPETVDIKIVDYYDREFVRNARIPSVEEARRLIKNPKVIRLKD
jgi:hypothetical protein